jgi:hypothetical protein
VEQANSGHSAPKKTIADVLAVFQNVRVERFAVWRQAIAVRTKLSGASTPPRESVPLEPEQDADAHSKLGAVVVLLVPVAGVAWAAIGWLLYRLLA